MNKTTSEALAEPKAKKPKVTFTGYQVFVIAILAFLQFTVILDFMVLSPLGPIVRPILNISTSQFGTAVAAYAFSAAISGLFAAGFADKFDRKKMLLFFYVGFVIGTFFCGIANSFATLFFARIFTGIFGGVLGSIVFAITTDLFAIQQRGRVMGFVQMAFSVSQVMGIPVGLWLAAKYDWHWPFLMIVAVSIVVGVIIYFKLKPVDTHLQEKREKEKIKDIGILDAPFVEGATMKGDKHPMLHLWHTLSNRYYLQAFLATALLATGGFMMMPFGSNFVVNNLGISATQLSFVFLIVGLFSFVTGPVVGYLSDKLGKFTVFFVGSIIAASTVIIYTNMGHSSVATVIAINAIMWVGISSRIISSQALMSSVPDMKDRGAFMGVNSSLQYISGGIASVIAGLIVQQKNQQAPLENFDIVGYVVVCTMAFTVLMIYFINKKVKARLQLANK